MAHNHTLQPLLSTSTYPAFLNRNMPHLSQIEYLDHETLNYKTMYLEYSSISFLHHYLHYILDYHQIKYYYHSLIPYFYLYVRYHNHIHSYDPSYLIYLLLPFSPSFHPHLHSNQISSNHTLFYELDPQNHPHCNHPSKIHHTT